MFPNAVWLCQVLRCPSSVAGEKGCNLENLWWSLQSCLVIPLVSYPELLSWGSAAFLGQHRDRSTEEVTSSALPKDCESINALLLRCSVQQIAVILAGCSTAEKHILMIWRNALVISYSCPLFKYWICSLACFVPLFEMYELEDGTGLYGYQSQPLLSDNSCPVAMKRFSEMPCRKDEYPSATTEVFFPWIISCWSFWSVFWFCWWWIWMIFWCCHTIIWCVSCCDLTPLRWGLLNNTMQKIRVCPCLSQ